MTETAYSITVKDLDHCGIAAGIIDQMGLVEEVNEALAKLAIDIGGEYPKTYSSILS